MAERLLSAQELAMALRVSPQTVYRAIKRNEIPANQVIKFGEQVRIKSQYLEALKDGKKAS